MTALPFDRTDHDRAIVMGVLNVTPDSFSDGGSYDSTDAAVARGIELHEQGADLVDVGGESTRPGADRVSREIELARVIPVVQELSNNNVPVSIDTTRAEVARQAVEVGAEFVNDVSGGLADDEMLATVAELGVPICLMHWRAPSAAMDEFTHYDDVVAEVSHHLLWRRDEAVTAGVEPDKIVLDPGLGFAKLGHHNWELLRELPALCQLGQPILVGASRKRFVGALLADRTGQPRPVPERDAATHAVSALAAANGAWAVRVHDVPGTLDAVKVAHEWVVGS